jgi:sulfur relay (sulfurtransferase) complex TusBCD TusD component (DsrE family)
MEIFIDGELTIRNCAFAFKCTAKWQDLTKTSNVLINFCEDCQREVYFCENDDELANAVRLNRCVAINRLEDLAEEDDYESDSFLMGVPRRKNPEK